MGCDIHVFLEKKNKAGTYEMVEGEILDHRSYALFGFLANVRNYSAVKPISEPRGIPSDVSWPVSDEIKSWDGDGHGHSWLSVKELTEFDYNQIMEDRRCTRPRILAGGLSIMDGGSTCEPGEGEKIPYSEFLGEFIMNEIKRLPQTGADRIVFFFDN